MNKVPNVSDEKSVVLECDGGLVRIGYSWNLIPNLLTDSGSKYTKLRGKELQPHIEFYERCSRPTDLSLSDKPVLKIGSKYYMLSTHVDVTIKDDLENRISLITDHIKQSFWNRRQLSTIIERLYKMFLLTENQVGESEYGSSRLCNVNKFSLKEFEDLLMFSGKYQETEYDVHEIEKELELLHEKGKGLDADKIKSGWFERVEVLKFKTA